MIKKALKLWDNYLDFLLHLPTPACFLASMATVLIPMILCATTLSATIDYRVRGYCLDSALPRRYSDKCEEFRGGEWVGVDPFGQNYYYNDVAGRMMDDE